MVTTNRIAGQQQESTKSRRRAALVQTLYGVIRDMKAVVCSLTEDRRQAERSCDPWGPDEEIESFPKRYRESARRIRQECRDASKLASFLCVEVPEKARIEYQVVHCGQIVYQHKNLGFAVAFAKGARLPMSSVRISVPAMIDE